MTFDGRQRACCVYIQIVKSTREDVKVLLTPFHTSCYAKISMECTSSRSSWIHYVKNFPGHGSSQLSSQLGGLCTLSILRGSTDIAETALSLSLLPNSSCMVSGETNGDCCGVPCTVEPCSSDGWGEPGSSHTGVPFNSHLCPYNAAASLFSGGCDTAAAESAALCFLFWRRT